MKKFPEKFRIKCPDCEWESVVPDEMRDQLQDSVLTCPICERRYVFENGRLLPEGRPTFNMKMTIESGKSKTVLEGDLLNESAKTMRQRGKFSK